MPKSPTSRLANVSGKCESSNLLVKRNDSCQCTDSSKTSSASDATCCKLVIIESYESRFSHLGRGYVRGVTRKEDATPWHRVAGATST